MLRFASTIFSRLGVGLLFCSTCVPAQAGTIIKLSLAGDPAADIEYTSGIVSTIDDGDASTAGEQNTAVEFDDFLTDPPLTSSQASFTLSGVTVDGPANTGIPGFVFQEFTGGSFLLWNEVTDTLLLSVDLGGSALFGPTTVAATGTLLTTSSATVTGGSLAPLLVANSITMSMSMVSVNGGAGFTVSGSMPNLVLNDFVADATLLITAEQEQKEIPEPTTVVLVLLGGLLLAASGSVVGTQCR